MKKSTLLFFIASLLLCSCKKDFLDKKPNKSLTTPTRIADYWAILDNREIMQYTPGMGQLASDDQYFLPSFLATQNAIQRNSYLWAADIYEGAASPEWQTGYQQVYYSNCILEGLENIPRDNANRIDWNNVRGSALFLRAYAFYNLAETFAKPYSAGASTDLGIVLRLSSDLGLPSVRASQQQTYDQIIKDLTEAKSLVPTALPENRTRPSKPAVTALLSRVLLSMGNFGMAEQYADSTLSNYSQLLDYNTVDPGSTAPFNRKDNPEVLYESHLYNWLTLISRANTLVDTALLASYTANDLRRQVFFRVNPAGRYYFKGRYSRLALLFSGLATDETYLTRAECRARRGQVAGALQDLNLLLANRWRKISDASAFTPYANLDAGSALNLILAERRKELVFRGIRWTDLRRLNREPGHEITLRRWYNNEQYLLAPDSKRYAFPIPAQEIALSGIQQNER